MSPDLKTQSEPPLQQGHGDEFPKQPCLPSFVNQITDALSRCVKAVEAWLGDCRDWTTRTRRRRVGLVSLVMALAAVATWFALPRGLLLPVEVTIVCTAVWRRPLRAFSWRMWKQLIAADPLFVLLAAVMIALVWGILADGFGLFYLFWHERLWVTFSAGCGVGLFWCTAGGVGYLLLRRSRSEAAGQVQAGQVEANDPAAQGEEARVLRAIFWLLIPPLFLCLCPIFTYHGPDRAVTDALQANESSWIAGLGRSIAERSLFLAGSVVALLVVWMIVTMWSIARVNARIDHAEERNSRKGVYAAVMRFGIFTLSYLLPLSAIISIGLVIVDQLIDLPGLDYLLVELCAIVILEAVARFSPRRIEEDSPLHRRAMQRLKTTKWLALGTGVALLLLYATNAKWGAPGSSFLIVLLTCFVSFTISSWMQEAGFRSRHGEVFDRIRCWALRALLIGVVLGLVAVLLAEALDYSNLGIPAVVVWSWMLLLTLWIWAAGWKPTAVHGTVEERLEQGNRSFFFFALVALIFLWILNHIRDVSGDEMVLFPPANLTISILMVELVLGYGWLRSFRRGRVIAIVLLLLLAHAHLNSWDDTPHRIRELEVAGYYDLKNRISPGTEQPVNNRPSLARYEQLRIDHRDVGLNDQEVLDKWKANIPRSGDAPPPLIIVTTSGGASASAIFTFAVLTELERQRPGITRNVRIITGASGGMLGAAYFRSSLPDFWKLDGQAKDDHVDRMHDALAKDFLSPVVQQWAFKDMPLALCPRYPLSNRGRALELVWHKEMQKALAKTFAQMSFQERNGLCPSIIFSPVLVEDGRQLLISTLNLDKLVGATPLPQAQGNSFREPSPLQAVEFFKLFPKATNLELATAVRLNATFPFLTPAATLPTVPPRRVMDAGFYDNHGINVAVAWIYANREWLMKNTSEVIVLQLRAFQKLFQDELSPAVTDDELDQIMEAGRKGKNWSSNASLLTFRELATPLESGINTLQSAMVLRNSLQLRMLQDLMPAKGAPSFRGISSYTFVGGAEASLNWYLPPRQVTELESVVREKPRGKWERDDLSILEKKESYLKARQWNRAQIVRLLASQSIKSLPQRP